MALAFLFGPPPLPPVLPLLVRAVVPATGRSTSKGRNMMATGREHARTTDATAVMVQPLGTSAPSTDTTVEPRCTPARRLALDGLDPDGALGGGDHLDEPERLPRAEPDRM